MRAHLVACLIVAAAQALTLHRARGLPTGVHGSSRGVRGSSRGGVHGSSHGVRGTSRGRVPAIRCRALSARGGGVPGGRFAVKEMRAAVVTYPLAALAAAFALGISLGLAGAGPLMDVFDRYHTVDDIPGHRFADRDAISAVVVKVADGDTMRARHVPALDFARGRWRPKSRAEGGKLKLSEETLQLRIYAVDAPETAKFGNKGMPFGDAATDFVKRRVDGRRVRVTLLAKDQYSRAVVKVQYGLFRKDLSEELVRAGLATIYRSGGGEYGPRGIEAWNAMEKRAAAQKVGLWSGGGAPMDPAAYKRAIRGA
mmetsp:Transcript_35514/g.109990  ORF Transcript_35514/g.109990 Transcript_35514/m.109990 type:complete len:312 (-) Transcript_35514:17-952(-)